jgi:hypothetical protein
MPCKIDIAKLLFQCGNYKLMTILSFGHLTIWSLPNQPRTLCVCFCINLATFELSVKISQVFYAIKTMCHIFHICLLSTAFWFPGWSHQTIRQSILVGLSKYLSPNLAFHLINGWVKIFRPDQSVHS